MFTVPAVVAPSLLPRPQDPPTLPGHRPSQILLFLSSSGRETSDIHHWMLWGTRSSRRTHNLQYCHLHQIKNQIFGMWRRSRFVRNRKSLLLLVTSSPLSWCGAEFCCNFSVISFLGSRSRPHLENFRQSVCCLFEYGRKPMHARVKWSDEVRCLIFSLVLLLFHSFGVLRTMSTSRSSTADCPCEGDEISIKQQMLLLSVWMLREGQLIATLGKSPARTH